MEKEITLKVGNVQVVDFVKIGDKVEAKKIEEILHTAKNAITTALANEVLIHYSPKEILEKISE